MCAEFMPERNCWITDVCWSPSGTNLVFASQDQYLYTVDLCNDIPSITHSIPLPGLSLSQLLFVSDTTIVCGGYDGQPYYLNFNIHMDQIIMMNDKRSELKFQKLIPIEENYHPNDFTDSNGISINKNNNNSHNSILKNHDVAIRTLLQESFFCNEKKGEIIDIHVPKKSNDKNTATPECDETYTNQRICSAIRQMKLLKPVNNTTLIVSSLGINNDFRLWKVPII